jgi:NAD(P)H-hydrate repair Nnr-like enzyme with NAD(P)H-hydrate epimerase domain
MAAYRVAAAASSLRSSKHLGVISGSGRNGGNGVINDADENEIMKISAMA